MTMRPRRLLKTLTIPAPHRRLIMLTWGQSWCRDARLSASPVGWTGRPPG